MQSDGLTRADKRKLAKFADDDRLIVCAIVALPQTWPRLALTPTLMLAYACAGLLLTCSCFLWRWSCCAHAALSDPLLRQTRRLRDRIGRSGCAAKSERIYVCCHVPVGWYAYAEAAPVRAIARFGIA